MIPFLYDVTDRSGYTSLDYHVFIGKPWGGLTALKKQEATRTVEDFNRNIQNRNYLLREARRYTR